MSILFGNMLRQLFQALGDNNSLKKRIWSLWSAGFCFPLRNTVKLCQFVNSPPQKMIYFLIIEIGWTTSPKENRRYTFLFLRCTSHQEIVLKIALI